jgi:hypothetical protein
MRLHEESPFGKGQKVRFKRSSEAFVVRANAREPSPRRAAGPLLSGEGRVSGKVTAGLEIGVVPLVGAEQNGQSKRFRAQGGTAVRSTRFLGFGGWRGPLVALSVATVALTGAGQLSAAVKQLTVCHIGCAYPSIQAAINAADDGGTVKIAAGTYEGSLTIEKSITLVGAGADQTTITQSGLDSVVSISSGVSVTMKAVTITGGSAEVCFDSGCSGSGGGIDNSGTLTLKGSIVSANHSAGTGGGITNSGTMTLSNSTVSGNSAGTGGGITNFGTLTLNSTTVSNNTAGIPSINGFSGGGIFNAGTLRLNDSTVSDNTVGSSLNVGTAGGGIDNSGTITLKNTTVSGNSAGSGGGIYNNGTVTLEDTTVSVNSGIFGGGIDNSGTLTLKGTTVAGNSAILGGGIYNSGAVVMSDSTVEGNDPDDLVGV